MDSIDALVEAGADIELKSQVGLIPLFHAAAGGGCKAMLTLLKRGANVRARAEEGMTPLHVACWGKKPGLEAAVDPLLRRGAKETAVNMNGQIPV